FLLVRPGATCMRPSVCLLVVLLAAFSNAAPRPVRKDGSGPMLGGSPSRNPVNLTDKNIPDDFAIKKGKRKHVKWSARLGTYAYGGPVIAGGRIFVGTNNDEPRDRKIRGDKGVLMCFREKDGKFLWQITHDKLPGGDLNDFARQGIISTPAVEGDHLYYVSNRAELVCADVAGNEKTKKGVVKWKYDMIKELDVFPCQASASSPLVVGDLVYVLTGNGIHLMTQKMPAPKAPAFIAVNKKTGKLAWKFNLPNPVIRGQWSNPTAATIK